MGRSCSWVRFSVITFMVLSLGSVTSRVGAQVRRAVLVGINDYTSAGPGALGVRGLGNLEGPVQDVAAMKALLVSRFGFRPGDIVELVDAEATREGILTAIRDHLGKSRAGDHALFFYAGHGSWVENSRSPEADHRDETLVPVDAASGVPDIRDKELRGPFDALLDRGADVTLIFDACHSGSITRAMEAGRDRSVRAAPGDVADGSVYPDPPQEHPSGRALVLSAARDDQKAREFMTAEGIVSGAFTWALIETLREAPRGVPASFLFQELRARMKEQGFEQEPVFEAGEARRGEPMLSAEPDARYTGTVVSILSIESERSVILQGGVALGLRPGSELVTIARDDLRAPARIRVVEALGVARSRGELASGSLSGIEPGELLAVDRWAADPAAPLRFWMPPPADDSEDAEAVVRTASLLRSDPRVRWVDDPTLESPTHTLFWTGTAWRLVGAGNSADLGPEPSITDLRSALDHETGPIALFVSLPPDAGLSEALARELGRSQSGRGVAVGTDSRGAIYSLVGTIDRGERRYWWMHVRAASGEASGGMPPSTDPVGGDARSLSRSLVTQIDRLARSWGWLHLSAPPGDAAFPFRISGFERADAGTANVMDDTLTWGGKYRVVLQAPPDALEAAVREAFNGGTARWHWYLFALDREGVGTLLYPRASNQPNTVNLLASETASRTRIDVPGGSGWLFSPAASNPEARSDFATVFLLASADPLPDPAAVLNFTGVGSRATEDADAAVIGEGSLSRMLYELGGASRGERLTAPVHWVLQRIPVVSTAGR